MSYYIPCDSVECCSVGLRVCREAGIPPKITVDTLTSQIGNDLCLDEEDEPLQQIFLIFAEGGSYIDPATGHTVYWFVSKYDTLDCNDRCTGLLGLVTGPGGYAGKQIFDFDIESKEYYGIDEFDVKMKFLNDHIDLYIGSKIERNDLKISIVSLLGTALVENNFGLTKGENYYQIKTNNLRTGMYLINIQINGYLLKTEKFIKVW